MAKSIFIDLNSVEFKFYLFTISLKICKADDDLFKEVYFLSGTKDVNVKVFNMITKVNQVKTLLKHSSYNFSCTFNSAASNSNENWDSDKCQCECKNLECTKKL